MAMDEHSRVTLSIEEAVADDAVALAQASRRAFDHDVNYGAPGAGGPPGYDSDLWQIRLMAAGDYYKLLLDGRIVGGLIVMLKGYGYYEVVRVFIVPERQNQGLGTRAFEFLWRRYPDVTRWTLGTPAWNRRTRHFYGKVGFVEVGEDRHGGILLEKTIEEERD